MSASDNPICTMSVTYRFYKINIKNVKATQNFSP